MNFSAINNEAEYETLTAGLQFANKLKVPQTGSQPGHSKIQSSRSQDGQVLSNCKNPLNIIQSSQVREVGMLGIYTKKHALCNDFSIY